MTRKKEEATAGLRRGRTLATAGLGAATLLGGLVYAMPANAATPTNPTVTLKMDAQIANDGSTPANFSIEVNNKQTGNADIADAALKVTLTMPAGIDCATDVSVTAVGAAPALSTSSTGATCVFTSGALTGPAFAADTDTTEAYTVLVDGQTAATPTSPAQYVTGQVTGVAELDANTSGGIFSSVLGTSTATSNLVTPGPATLANTSAPVANYGENYGFQVVTSPGFPETPVDDTTTGVSGGYAAWGVDNSDATPPTTADEVRGADAAVQVTTGTAPSATNDYYISLNDSDTPAGTATGASQTGFFFDTVSGKIVYGTLTVNTDQTKNTFVAGAPTGLSAVNFDPQYTWVIVANNGEGTTAVGAKLGATGIAANLEATTTGDVASAASSLDVGFSDVSSTSPFLNDIDTLARNGVINGYINGTYGPKQSVNREQFVAFAARLYALTQGGAVTDYNGACSATVDPSQFNDVPNNNQFCKAIQQMASLGVVNGYTATTFGPTKIVQRQEIAAFLVRLAEAINNSPVTDLPKASTGFSDVPASSIFSGDINWLVGNKITKGATATTFAPHADALRQEVAAFVNRFAGTLATNPLV